MSFRLNASLPMSSSPEMIKVALQCQTDNEYLSVASLEKEGSIILIDRLIIIRRASHDTYKVFVDTLMTRTFI